MTKRTKPGGAARKLRHTLAYWWAASILAVLKALPPDAASALGGWMVSTFGPLSWRHRVAHENLARVFPDMPARERRRIVHQMWANFGRVAGEYPHLRRIMDDRTRIELVGMDEIRAALDGHKSALLLSAHYGNWEVTSVAPMLIGLLQAHVYRRIDNQMLDRLVDPLLRVTAPGGLIAKDEATISTMTHLLRNGVSIALLVDHRERRGISVPFLGLDAETVHSPAILARRLGVPIIIARGIRTGGARFRVECAHVPVPVTGDGRADVEAATRRINDMVGEWIRERPEQWYWVHRRWKVSRSGDRPIAAAAGPRRRAAPSRR